MEPPGGVLQRLHTVLDDVGDASVSCMAGSEALDWVCGLERIRARLDSIICRHLASVGSDALIEAETGHRSVATAVAARTGCNPCQPRADAHLGTWLADYPVLADAFERGELSLAHVRAIRARQNKRSQAYLPEAQGYLVEAAQGCTWAEFQALLRYWEVCADPDGEEPDEQVASRRCNYSKQADGTVTGNFTLDPLAGDAFVTAMERHIQRLFHHDAEADSKRTAGQRRADALVDLVTHGAAGPGTASKPLVHLILGEDVLTDGFSRLDSDVAPTVGPAGTGPGDRLPLNHDDPLGRCELIDGTPIHPRFALATLATVHLRRLVVDADSEVLDLGRTVRSFPARLKQLLLISARGRCQSPGCDSPHAWLQADHLIPWSRGGATSVANGQILCDPHNKVKRDRPPSDPSPGSPG